MNKMPYLNPAALSALAQGDPGNVMTAATPGGIEAQEKQGQQILVASDMLPKEIHGATRQELEAMGFKFGADIDNLFVECTLPAGWRKEGTEHDMHSKLLDAKGRPRAGIFFKAAFYDRRADMNMYPRYGYSAYERGPSKSYLHCVIKDAGQKIHEIGQWMKGDYTTSEAMQERAKEHLNTLYPDWKNPLAYWNQE